MERWLPARQHRRGWGAIDRFMDEPWDQFYRQFFGPPALGRPDFGVIEPAVDVFETDDHMVVKAELPGLEPSELSVRVTEDSVAFRGETGEEHEERKEDYHYRERRHGLIQRMVPLARRVDPDSARASFRNGILTIKAAKLQSERGRSVDVKIESDQTDYGRTH